MRFTLSKIPFVEPVQFIGGLFPRRQVSVIASEPGCGKTWCMLKFCADMSNSQEWGKFYGCSWVEPDRKCMMLIGDSGKEMIVERIFQLGIDNVADENNFTMYFVEDMLHENFPFLLNTPEGRSAINTLIQNDKPDIVFFDTLISFMTGDENSAKEVGEIFIELRSMAEENNCAIVLNHHFRKAGKNETRKKTATLSDVIGSSAMSRLSSVMIGMTRNRDNEEHNEVNVFSIKSWYKEMLPFSFEIASNDKGKVELIPFYVKGNTKRAVNILTSFSKQVNSGIILSLKEIQETTHIPEGVLKSVIDRHPAYTPLTDEPNCDRFIVHQQQEGSL